MVNYIKMPEPLLVLGFMYVIYGLLNIIAYIKSGFWNGMLVEIKTTLISKIKIAILFILAILLMIYFVDKPISMLCQHLYNVDVYTLTDFIASMGEGWFIIGILFTLALIEEFRGCINNAILLRIALMASIFAGIANALLKFVFNRERPSINMDPLHFFSFFTSHNKNWSDLIYASNSMPSGHTIMVVAAVTVLYLYSTRKLSKIFLVLTAVLIAYARVYTINHWFSDVCVSAMFGFIIGQASYRANKFRLKFN